MKCVAGDIKTNEMGSYTAQKNLTQSREDRQESHELLRALGASQPPELFVPQMLN